MPAQIMLGILAQESNFWQASRYSVPGVPGNPLVGNYYGTDRDSAAANAWWQINYPNADCGYGIAQVTDKMRSGEMPYADQLAIATDYQANIARGLQILIDKWNQTRQAGLTINNGDPAYLENWFYALWAYNSGFYPQAGAGEPWGVGWLNNPANPLYPPNRGSFLNGTPEDAANPQRWPYPEKVLGFAANSVQFLDSVSQGSLGDTFAYVPAFTPAWWTASDGSGGTANRAAVKPPVNLFCDARNSCNPSTTDRCTRSDSKCWFHYPATWKSDCQSACGYEYLSYSLSDAKPNGASSYPANCSTSGLPSGALIVDNLPSGTASRRPGCSPVASNGSFAFTFAGDGSGTDPSKVDIHQLGSGFNGQFYFTHARVPGTDEAFAGKLDVSGTWTLGQAINGWAQVYVHMPNHGAWSQQAAYVVNTGSTTTTRIVNQRNYANTWVSLGTLQFAGTPTVSLSNNRLQYGTTTMANGLSGIDDIAWDAVAFVPLPTKPADFVVALGDSYSSGEGTSAADGSGFLRGSDHHGSLTPNSAGQYVDDVNRNGCHRADTAWPFLIAPPHIVNTTVKNLAAAKDPRLDFQFLPCAGAEVKNVRSGTQQQYGERAQLDRGFLDGNTTLVTLSIGGNDIGFGPIISSCIKGFIVPDVLCKDIAADGYNGTNEVMVNERLGSLPASVASLLSDIHGKAPNARILLLGYPKIFESGGSCALVRNENSPWLNSIADRLNRALTEAAVTAGAYVTYQNPQYLFAGQNLCAASSKINGLVLSLTPGDKPLAQYTGPGPNYGVPVSAQSFHPTADGAVLYSTVANNALRSTRVPLSSSLVGGQATTYYSTFRLHQAGPASFNVTSFSSCGGEIRFGLRKDDGAGALGQQDTDSLAWSSKNAMQTFVLAGSGTNTWLPSGMYALNGRLTNSCAGNPDQPWAAELFW